MRALSVDFNEPLPSLILSCLPNLQRLELSIPEVDQYLAIMLSSAVEGGSSNDIGTPVLQKLEEAIITVSVSSSLGLSPHFWIFLRHYSMSEA